MYLKIIFLKQPQLLSDLITNIFPIARRANSLLAFFGWEILENFMQQSVLQVEEMELIAQNPVLISAFKMMQKFSLDASGLTLEEMVELYSALRTWREENSIKSLDTWVLDAALAFSELWERTGVDPSKQRPQLDLDYTERFIWNLIDVGGNIREAVVPIFDFTLLPYRVFDEKTGHNVNDLLANTKNYFWDEETSEGFARNYYPTVETKAEAKKRIRQAFNACLTAYIDNVDTDTENQGFKKASYAKRISTEKQTRYDDFYWLYYFQIEHMSFDEVAAAHTADTDKIIDLNTIEKGIKRAAELIDVKLRTQITQT